MTVELNLTRDVRGTKKIFWLAASPTNRVPVDLVSFDHPITRDTFDLKKEVLDDFLTTNTATRVPAFADCSVRDLQQGAVIQFDRKGYFRLDATDQVTGNMVFFQIP
jgi:glutamyl-tRNA synthetase